MFKKLLFILLNFSLNYCLTNSLETISREECLLRKTSMDLCGREILMIGNTGQEFPETRVGWETGLCRQRIEALDCLQSYSENCLEKSLTKRFFQQFLRKTNETNICNEEIERKDLFLFIKCFNSRLNSIHECMNRFINQMKEIEKNVQNLELLMPYSCCQLIELKKCVATRVRTCGPKAEDILWKHFLWVFEQSLCSQEMTENNKFQCYQLEPLFDEVNTETSLSLPEDVLQQSLSPFISIINILNRLSPISKCEKMKERADDCAVHVLIVGDREQLFPLSEKELMATTCPTIEKNIQCLEEFNEKCLKGKIVEKAENNEWFSLLLLGLKQELGEKCFKKNFNQSILYPTQCLNKALEGMNSCYESFVQQLQSLRLQLVDNDLRLMYTCCAFHQMKKCSIKSAKNKCFERNEKNGKIIEEFQEFLEKSLNPMLDKMCSDYYENSEQCLHLDPFSDSNEELADNYFIPQSFVMPLTEMFFRLNTD